MAGLGDRRDRIAGRLGEAADRRSASVANYTDEDLAVRRWLEETTAVITRSHARRAASS